MHKLFLCILLLMLLVSSCSAPKTSIIRGQHIITEDGTLEEITASPGENLPVVRLENEGDKAIIAYGSRIDFTVDIDTSNYTVTSYFDNENQEVVFEVVKKGEFHDVTLQGLCDFYIIPEKNVYIKLIDNYNHESKNKKYKIITVPILNYNHDVTGYLIRYDLEGVSKECKTYRRIMKIENDFAKYRSYSYKRKSKTKKKSDCPCIPPEHCNCKEYIYFGKCCK